MFKEVVEKRPAGARGTLDPQKPCVSCRAREEAKKVIANTKAPKGRFLSRPASHDAKPVTWVKAIANEYADGLRLVEVKKNQLYQIPDLMDQLRPTRSSSSSSSMT